MFVDAGQSRSLKVQLCQKVSMWFDGGHGKSTLVDGGQSDHSIPEINQILV